MLTGQIEITQHAAEQYIRRINRTLSLVEAHALLTAQAPNAAPLKVRTPKGDEQWRLDEPCSCVLVIKRDKKNERKMLDGARVVVTVLELHDVIAEDMPIDMAPSYAFDVPRTRKQRRARRRSRMRART